MRRHPLVWGVLLMIALSSLVLGTGGFSAASMDRYVNIDIAADHEDALVSIRDAETADPMYKASESRDDRRGLIVVTNRFSDHALDIEVSNREGSQATVTGSHEGLPPRASATISATVDCGQVQGHVSVPLKIIVWSQDGSVEGVIDYETSIDCSVRSPTTVSAGDTTPATLAGNAETPVVSI